MYTHEQCVLLAKEVGIVEKEFLYNLMVEIGFESYIASLANFELSFQIEL